MPQINVEDDDIVDLDVDYILDELSQADLPEDLDQALINAATAARRDGEEQFLVIRIRDSEI